MTNRIKADQIVKNHVMWSMGGGLIPLPLLDLAAVTAIQLDMLKQITNLYEVEYSEQAGKAMVTALTGTTLAKIGSSFIKAIPGVGTIIGGLSMSILSGASTYAIGQIAINHFEGGGSLFDVDFTWAKKAYEDAFEQGKEFASKLEKEKASVSDVTDALEKLGELKEKGIISEEEFAEQKKKLLEKI